MSREFSIPACIKFYSNQTPLHNSARASVFFPLPAFPHTSALDLLHIKNGKESCAVDAFHDAFQLCHFLSSNLHIENVFVIFQKSSLSMKAGDRVMHIVYDGRGDFVVLCGNNEYAF